ncbi:MAG: FAD-dependent oxidoreductase [Puniceicoccales bacterium]|nr:FAD-dependent oxidoreductase [Puniceicoccales bacterium]
MSEIWDAIVIGAGMSGLGAGIRLALAGKKVILLEKHNTVGGLNGYYYRHGCKYDVGLHAMTNFISRGGGSKPFAKLCRQLRLPYEAFQLTEQIRSCIHFPHIQLYFNNDFELLRSEISQKFPSSIDAFDQLAKTIIALNDTALSGTKFISTRARLKDFIKDNTLREMLLLPLLYYGSAHANDIDWRQFAILFKAIYLEGFARPRGGVRTLLHLLREHYHKLGGILRVKTPAVSVTIENNCASAVHLKTGEILRAHQIFSSIGYRETLRLLPGDSTISSDTQTLSFLETITTLPGPPWTHNWHNTIVFYNDFPTVNYATPETYVDLHSGVVCVPENYQDDAPKTNTTLRTTHLANYDAWKSLSQAEYFTTKQHCLLQSRQKAFTILGQPSKIKPIAEDVFTPLTVERYTGHIKGAVYGYPNKIRDGNIGLTNLFICGTDQGFLGIVGALLSGISMVNYHTLQSK